MFCNTELKSVVSLFFLSFSFFVKLYLNLISSLKLLVKYKFDDNTEIMATDDHPFYVGENYRTLEVGDEVLNDELNKIKVVSVEKIDGLIETYNINRTNNGKNYFANRVLVSDESETE